MSCIYPGVLAGDGRQAVSLGEAAEWAQRGALRAADRGTFCVGGVLLGPGLELLAESSNHVLCDGAVCDPTAHGERQLVDWYFDQKGMPAADQCTLVSTLDPCIMCAGSLLYAGFRVVSLSLDLEAGVNWTADQSFQALPPALRSQARERFAYLGVEGVRPAFGCADTVTAEFEERSRQLFQESLPRVQASIHARQVCPLYVRQWVDEPAALLDPSGQVVAVASDGPHTRTAVMELARTYALKDFTLVQRRGPNLGALSVMEMGAYGSCLEGPLPPSPRARWQYLQPGCSAEELTDQLGRMPPHYRKLVGMRIEAAGSIAGPL
ncbi:nucleoside deaminase [bacterium]|nr:nucleoside deaminase [bacterium]